MRGFVVVHGRGVSGPGPLERVLEARGRDLTVLAAGDAVPEIGEVRALVLRGDPGPGFAALAVACAEAEVPLLGVGAGALAVADAVGAPLTGAAAQPPTRVRIAVTDAGQQDPVGGPLPPGSLWLTDLVLGPADGGWSVLATGADGAPVLATRGAGTVVSLRCDLSLDEVEALLADDPSPAIAARFVHACGAALLGRWVDRTVGRTEEETPWGRRGPGPVPRAGVVLHPA